MIVGPECGFENPAGARFCAGWRRQAPGDAGARARGAEDGHRRLLLRHWLDRAWRQARTCKACAMLWRGTSRRCARRSSGTAAASRSSSVTPVDGRLRRPGRARRRCPPRRPRGNRHAEALAGLNEEFERGLRHAVEARIGVNTGEVVTGTEERSRPASRVNVAARLEQAAAPGEILLGAETLRLLRGAVTVEELGALQRRARPRRPGLPPCLRPGRSASSARRADGRSRPRAAPARRRLGAGDLGADVRPFTLLGAAGVGKSRLTEEFLSGVDATLVRGRCLSYGEGITYWPVTEIVLQLAQLGHNVSVRSARGAAWRGESADIFRGDRPRVPASARAGGGRARPLLCRVSTTCTGASKRCLIWSSTRRP